jgi:hypothetical protein
MSSHPELRQTLDSIESFEFAATLGVASNYGGFRYAVSIQPTFADLVALLGRDASTLPLASSEIFKLVETRASSDAAMATILLAIDVIDPRVAARIARDLSDRPGLWRAAQVADRILKSLSVSATDSRTFMVGTVQGFDFLGARTDADRSTYPSAFMTADSWFGDSSFDTKTYSARRDLRKPAEAITQMDLVA